MVPEWGRILPQRFSPLKHDKDNLVSPIFHDDVIKWKHFPRYWPFVRGIHRWIPHTKASDAELWCFVWSVPEQTVEQTIETLVNWDVIALIMASL